TKMCAAVEPDPLAELQRENEVIERLLARLEEIALILKDGKDVAPGEVSEGLHLLDQYLGIHARRIDEDLQPEARLVAMSTCFVHLDRIVRDHTEATRRTAEALRALTEYENPTLESRGRLADSLEQLASQDHDAVVYEGDFPLSCLLSALPDDAAGRVSEKFAATDPDMKDAQGHIERLLASPPGEAGSSLKVHCSHADCHASTEGRVIPGRQGKLGLLAPPGGWIASPQQPRMNHDGAIRVRIDFYCPEHDGPSVSEESSRARATWEDEGGTPGPPTSSTTAEIAAGRL
ncbi:MAG: hypothetical protein ACRD6W_17765, partial [Nitrososphaerales archaeon]